MADVAAGGGALRRVLEAAGRNARVSLKQLTVLSTQRDPYRFDTPVGHRDAIWFRDHIERLGYLDRNAIALGEHRTIHLRGAHYAIFSSGGVLKPNGKPYTNTDEDWIWLQEDASRKARWLGYVPFECIVDQRNEAPVIHRRDALTPRGTISIGVDVDIPTVEDLVPTVLVHDFGARQAHHLVLFGEKTGLAEVLLPIARDYGADLYLPSGEISDTLLYQMAKDDAEDGRPMVVFTFTDCDPAGRQMSVSIARKLQGLRDLFFTALDFEVRPVALTVEQVREYGLPSTPLKSTEQRASNWRREFGIDQTEIDALAALRPDLLRQIARQALDPFDDRTLASRVSLAQSEWLVRAQATLDEQVDGDMLARLRADASDKLAELEAEIEAINVALETAVDDIDLALPPFEVPEPLPLTADGKPLISSRWDWASATRALIAHKTYGNDGDRP